MNKKTFRAKIENGICTTYGSCSFYKSGRQYYYGRYGEKGRETKVFENFNDLWAEIGHYFLFGVDRKAAALAPFPEVNPGPGPENENQNERWMRIHNLKLCKCGARISVNHKTCYACWKWDKLDRDHWRYINVHASISPYKKSPKQGRLITFRQEQALRLCHQDFEGLDQPEAAKQMGINQSVLSRLLNFSCFQKVSFQPASAANAMENIQSSVTRPLQKQKLQAFFIQTLLQ